MIISSRVCNIWFENYDYVLKNYQYCHEDDSNNITHNVIFSVDSMDFKALVLKRQNLKYPVIPNESNMMLMARVLTKQPAVFVLIYQVRKSKIKLIWFKTLHGFTSLSNNPARNGCLLPFLLAGHPGGAARNCLSKWFKQSETKTA